MSLAAALLAFQAEAPTLSKNKTGKVHGTSKAGKPYEYEYRYTDLHTIAKEVGPLLQKHRLIWTTRPTGTIAEPALAYELTWVPEDRDPGEGDTIAGEMPLLLPDHPTSQTFGSAITYARRYAKVAVLDLDADEDDDGQAAMSAPARSYGKRQDTGEVATDAQKKKVRAEATKAGLTSVAEWKQFATAVLGLDVPINGLTKKQASIAIDRLVQGAIPTGESDVPGASGDEFKHEPVRGEDVDRIFTDAEVNDR
jgi:hypothetical protein